MKITSCSILIEREVTDMTSKDRDSNKRTLPGKQQVIDNMKYEIAQEFGIKHEEASSTSDDSDGEEITKQLIQMAHEQNGKVEE